MNREDLVRSADEIGAAGKDAADEYAEKRDRLTAEIDRIMLGRPDIDALVGADNREMMKDNHANHARFIESILRRFNAETLVETVLWVFRSYRSRGFHQNYWSAQINAWIGLLKKELSPGSLEKILPLYQWLSVHIPAFTDLSDEMMAKAEKHGEVE